MSQVIDYSSKSIGELLTSIFYTGKRIAMADGVPSRQADADFHASELPKMRLALQTLGHEKYPGISTGGIADQVLRWAGEVAPMNNAVQNDIVDQIGNITALDNKSWSHDSTAIDGFIASLIGKKSALRSTSSAELGA